MQRQAGQVHGNGDENSEDAKEQDFFMSLTAVYKKGSKIEVLVVSSASTRASCRFPAKPGVQKPPPSSPSLFCFLPTEGSVVPESLQPTFGQEDSCRRPDPLL